ncbi:hypothetical protein AAG906_036906 [Vitis piasezkii]
MTSKVYLRKKVTVPKLIQVQKSEPPSRNEALEKNKTWEMVNFPVRKKPIGYMEKEIYIEVPPRFSSDPTTKKVCKLKKALYGLKRSPRVWFKRFAKVMKNMRHKQSQGDHIIFISQHKYVTDLLKEIGKLACKPTSTPIDPNHKLGEAEEDTMVDRGDVSTPDGKTHLSLSHKTRYSICCECD